MSIHHRVYTEHPHGIVMTAVDAAATLVAGWGASGGNEDARAAMTGWSAVHLIEGIARLVLDQRGYDEELLDRACEGDPPDGWTLGDLDAALDRSRRL